MKILLLNWRDTAHPKSGGAEIVTMEHAKAWARMGHSVTWLTSWYRGGKTKEIVDGVQIIRNGGSLLVYPCSFLYVLCNSSKYDVIVDEIHALPFFAPLVSRRPVVAFIHEVAGVIWNYMGPFPFNRIGPILERFYFPLYRKTLFWTDASSTIEELMRFGISKEQCVSIPCPIINPPVKKLPQKESIFTLLFVSRVVAMKGIEDVIRAFAFVEKQETPVQLWIVGGGDPTYIQKLKQMILTLGIHSEVHFYGKVPEVRKLDLMGRAHLLLHASVKEGWGLVVLEAASQGTPSVVYNVSGLRDVVKNGETGVVVKENTPQGLGEQAIRLYRDREQYATFQRKGIEWVKHFTWADATEQSLALLVKAAGKKV